MDGRDPAEIGFSRFVTHPTGSKSTSIKRHERGPISNTACTTGRPCASRRSACPCTTGRTRDSRRRSCPGTRSSSSAGCFYYADSS